MDVKAYCITGPGSLFYFVDYLLVPYCKSGEVPLQVSALMIF